MVGTGLILSELKKEIEKYLGTPYARNYWQEGRLIKEAVFGGKGDWEQIEYATRCAAEKEGLNYDQLGVDDKRQLQKNYRIGIDCSGLTYHLLDRLDKVNGGGGILYKMVGVTKDWGQLGVRVVSAADQTNSLNSVAVGSVSEAKTGDLIRHNKGTHVLMVVENLGDRLVYVHSSNGTKVNGVHYGEIVITNSGKPLNEQKWSDETKNSDNYADLFYPDSGDGIFRPKFLG